MTTAQLALRGLVRSASGKIVALSELSEGEAAAGNPSKTSPPPAGSFAAANARVCSVMESQHFKGREALAATLLRNEKLSADEIIAALAAAQSTNRADAEAREAEERAAMLGALRSVPNSKVIPNSIGGTGGNANADTSGAAGWAKAHAAVNAQKGF